MILRPTGVVSVLHRGGLLQDRVQGAISLHQLMHNGSLQHQVAFLLLLFLFLLLLTILADIADK